MFGTLTTDEIEQVFHNNIIGRIGCHADGKTYVVPISYAYDGSCIYAHTYEGMKMNIMRKNPEVCFQADNMQNMANWQSVIAWGTFEELTDPEKRTAALKILTDRVLPHIASETVKLTPQWPFPPDQPEKIEGVVFRICIYEKSGKFEAMNAQAK